MRTDLSSPIAEPDVAYDGAVAVLVIADSEAATVRAQAAVRGAGMRALMAVPPDNAGVWLDRLPGCVFVELDDASPELDALMEDLSPGTDSGRCRLIVSTPSSAIDVVASRLKGGAVQQLADATHADRVAALLAPARPSGVRECGGQGADALRLRALTDEVGRIAGALARLSGGVPPVPPSPAIVDPDADAAYFVELARIGRVRSLRGRHFDPALFADPAWDMLLDLAAARIGGKPVAVSSLCIAAAVPPTTALRWIKMLTDAGLFVRRADPADGRRVFIDLGDDAFAAMRAYLADVRRPN